MNDYLPLPVGSIWLTSTVLGKNYYGARATYARSWYDRKVDKFRNSGIILKRTVLLALGQPQRRGRGTKDNIHLFRSFRGTF